MKCIYCKIIHTRSIRYGLIIHLLINETQFEFGNTSHKSDLKKNIVKGKPIKVIQIRTIIANDLTR